MPLRGEPAASLVSDARELRVDRAVDSRLSVRAGGPDGRSGQAVAPRPRYSAYGVGSEGNVHQRQERNLAALLDGYGPSKHQRSTLADAVGKQMLGHASDLEDMARTDPAFARLLDLDYARAARQDAGWWAKARLNTLAFGTL